VTLTGKHVEGSKVRAQRRRRALVLLAVAGLLLIPAAISWACGPNRAIELDKVTYGPDDAVEVSGANFDNGATVDIKVDGSTVVTTTVDGTGHIATSFRAPSSPGTYAVRTDGVNTWGQALEGTGNTRMLSVAAEPGRAPGGGTGGGRTPGTSGPETGSEEGAAPRRTSGADGKGGTGDNQRSATGGERIGRAPANGGVRTDARAPADSGVNTTEGAITTGGTTAFAGSVTQATRADVAERATGGGPTGGSPSPAPSERSAGADLWSGLGSGENPSLVPGNDAGLAAPDTGSGLAWGLLLLAAGLLALIALGVAEARRRRRAPAA